MPIAIYYTLYLPTYLLLLVIIVIIIIIIIIILTIFAVTVSYKGLSCEYSFLVFLLVVLYTHSLRPTTSSSNNKVIITILFAGTHKGLSREYNFLVSVFVVAYTLLLLLLLLHRPITVRYLHIMYYLGLPIT